MSWGIKTYDAIIIGSDLHSLIAAAELCRARKKVLVVGGGDVGRANEQHEDSAIASVPMYLEGFPKNLERRFRLARHGFYNATSHMRTIALDRGGKHILLPEAAKDFAFLSPKDAEACREYLKRLNRDAQILTRFLKGDGRDWKEKKSLSRFLKGLVWQADLRCIPLKDLARRMSESIGDYLDAEIETPLLKGLLAFDAIAGSADSPYAAGTSFRALSRHTFRLMGRGISLPHGGVRALSQALAAYVAEKDGEICTDIFVRKILHEYENVRGVELNDGRVIYSPLVVALASSEAVVNEMLDPEFRVNRSFAASKKPAKNRNTARINLVLDGVPNFTNLSYEGHQARLVIAPSLEELDQAHNAFRRNELPCEPIMEIILPSMVNKSYMLDGRHVVSIAVHYIPHNVDAGWQEKRGIFFQRVLRTLEAYAPGIGNMVFSGEVLSPEDIATKHAPSFQWPVNSMMPAEFFGVNKSFSVPEVSLSGLHLSKDEGNRLTTPSIISAHRLARKIVKEDGAFSIFKRKRLQ